MRIVYATIFCLIVCQLLVGCGRSQSSTCPPMPVPSAARDIFRGNDPQGTEFIVFRTDVPPERMLSFYKSSLLASGWYVEQEDTYKATFKLPDGFFGYKCPVYITTSKKRDGRTEVIVNRNDAEM